MSDLLADPPVRADDLCVVCLEPRLARKLAPVYQGLAELDPFCSNTCARSWHGVPAPAVGPVRRRAYVESLPRGR